MSDVAPIWFLNRGTTFFAGTLDYNAPHQHGAPVFLAGLDGSFGLRLQGTRWLICRTAMIPAGLVHELDVGGQPIGVLYSEDEDVSAFTSLVGTHEEIGGALIGTTGDAGLLRALFEDPRSLAWIGEGLGDLLRFARRKSERAGRLRPRDRRLRYALEPLDPIELSDPEGQDALVLPTSMAGLAARAGLSTSRFQHLFSKEMGVPLRRYRCWVRMRRAIHEIVKGANFTAAAYSAGYADQAHFAHDFRRTFGAPASRSLKGLRF